MLLMFMMKFDYVIFMLFEIYTVLFLLIVINSRSSYERGRANIYLIFFRYVIRMGVVIINNLMLIRALLLMLRMSKLPIYGLHIWLPKVHVEASILRSIILARGVLKLGILYMWNFRILMILRIVVIRSLLILITSVDGKIFAAISSVLHITLCVLVGLYIILMIRYIHIVISPYIFMTVYLIYLNGGTRFYMKMGVTIIILWIVNFRLPMVRRFFSEVYLIMYCRMILMMLLIIYMVVGYVIIKSINDVRRRVYYIPWFVLYILVI